MKIKNVNVHADESSARWSAGFEYNGARYHVWFKPETLEIEASLLSGRKYPLLYKNPPRGIEPNKDGYFTTRYLDATAKNNAILIAAMFAEIKERGLIEEARRKVQERKRKHDEESIAQYKLQLQKEAGPQLYEAVKALLAWCDGPEGPEVLFTVGVMADYPREEILRRADHAVKRYREQGLGADAYFKFTCAHCGERVTFVEPNALYESGECVACGKITEVVEAGFALHISMGKKDEN